MRVAAKAVVSSTFKNSSRGTGRSAESRNLNPGAGFKEMAARKTEEMATVLDDPQQLVVS